MKPQHEGGGNDINVNTVDITEFPGLLKIAESAAQDAGNYLVGKRGLAHIKSQKSSRDDLLDVDLEAESIILTKLRQETPTIGILAEETGSEGSQEHYWIIDPLDGSANFQHGNPTFAVTV